MSNKNRLFVVIIAIVLLFSCFCYSEAFVSESVEEAVAITIKSIDPTKQPFELIDTAITFPNYEYKAFYDVELSTNYMCNLIV